MLQYQGIVKMKTQSQWLFEAPFASEAAPYNDPYLNREYRSDIELEIALLERDDMARQKPSKRRPKNSTPASPANFGNAPNLHHWLRINKIVERMKQLGWQDIRVDQPQVAGGKRPRRVGQNRPDISGINPKTGQRVNIEIDTKAKQSKQHQNVVVRKDRNAVSTFIKINGQTGKPTGARTYKPGLGFNPPHPQRGKPNKESEYLFY